MLKSNKKAVSTIIAYVLLIGFAVSMSILVYNWLRLYTAEDESQSCPESVALSIENISISSENKILNLTLKNRGHFNIHEIVVKVASKSSGMGVDRVFPIQEEDYTIQISIGESVNITYDLDEVNCLNKGAYVDIQPVIFDKGKIVYCSTKVSQIISFEGAINCKVQNPDEPVDPVDSPPGTTSI